MTQKINEAKWPDLTSHFRSAFSFHTYCLDYSFPSQLCLISYPQQTCKFISLASFLCRCPASMSSFRTVSRGGERPQRDLSVACCCAHVSDLHASLFCCISQQLLKPADPDGNIEQAREFFPANQETKDEGKEKDLTLQNQEAYAPPFFAMATFKLYVVHVGYTEGVFTWTVICSYTESQSQRQRQLELI